MKIGELTGSNNKKLNTLLYILLILYILYPIGELYFVAAPNLEYENSIEKYISYFWLNTSKISDDGDIKELESSKENTFMYNNFKKLEIESLEENTSGNEDFKKLESLKENFYMINLVNGWTNIILPIIDFIITIFYCCGLREGYETTVYCCFICDFFYNCGCIKCLTKAALNCPLLFQSLLGIINIITIPLLMATYNDTKSIIKKLMKRYNIDKIHIDFKSNQTYNALFLTGSILLLILTVVYYCLKGSCPCCSCCCCCCSDTCLPNPPKIDVIISQKESKHINNINSKRKNVYKIVSIE